ncbi:hypothetical protein CLD22_28605, partial [Rubrivivax gelatinosus]|nr:hypothetical protein [Rubrivivax gelatinosus]
IDTLRASERGAAWQGVRFPGRAWRDEDSIRDLLGGFAELRVDDVVAELVGDPAAAWGWYGGVYELQMMSPAERERFGGRFRAAVARLSAEGQAAASSLHFRLIRARCD